MFYSSNIPTDLIIGPEEKEGLNLIDINKHQGESSNLIQLANQNSVVMKNEISY
jgi:hypothetical protein